MKKVLFVCLGNICRSPTAEGIFLHLVKQNNLKDKIFVDSAGTVAHHIGESADPRSQQTANHHGIFLPSRARQIRIQDFTEFDYIFAMDKSNLRNILALTDTELDNVFLFRDFDPNSPKGSDVPDPYYGGSQGFENVFALCHSTCSAILEHIKQEI